MVSHVVPISEVSPSFARADGPPGELTTALNPDPKIDNMVHPVAATPKEELTLVVVTWLAILPAFTLSDALLSKFVRNVTLLVTELLTNLSPFKVTVIARPDMSASPP